MMDGPSPPQTPQPTSEPMQIDTSDAARQRRDRERQRRGRAALRIERNRASESSPTGLFIPQ